MTLPLAAAPLDATQPVDLAGLRVQIDRLPAARA